MRVRWCARWDSTHTTLPSRDSLLSYSVFILFGRQTAIALLGETSEPQALYKKRKILRSAKWNPFFNSGQAVQGAEGKDLRNESLGFLKPSHLCGAGRKNEKRGKQVGLLSNGVSRPL